MYTISRLAKLFNLSRSTILYYDAIGLLKPARRGKNQYRIYTQSSADRLKAVCRLRDTGLPLKTIKNIIAAHSSKQGKALLKRLDDINVEINALRQQQRVIAGMLERDGHKGNARIINKAQWVSFLRAAGLDEAGMRRWHIAFESSSPHGHQDFLESLSIDADEIKRIRQWSREGYGKDQVRPA